MVLLTVSPLYISDTIFYTSGYIINETSISLLLTLENDPFLQHLSYKN